MRTRPRSSRLLLLVLASLPLACGQHGSLGDHASDTGTGGGAGGTGDSGGDGWVVNAGIAGVSGDDVYIAGYLGAPDGGGFVKKREGEEWTTVYDSGPELKALWVGSASQVFAVGYGAVVRLVEGDWQRTEVGDDETILRDVWGTRADDVFAVGFHGEVFHFDGDVWSPMSTGTAEDLQGVWGSAHDDVFAVGKVGTIVRYDGESWSGMDSGVTVDLKGVWGSSPTDVYAVGGQELDAGYAILHCDGSTWTTVETGDSRMTSLIRVRGTSAEDVYVVGGYRAENEDGFGVILRYDGNGWQEVPNDIEMFLWDVWPDPSGGYVVVGPGDTVVHMGE